MPTAAKHDDVGIQILQRLIKAVRFDAFVPDDRDVMPFRKKFFRLNRFKRAATVIPTFESVGHQQENPKKTAAPKLVDPVQQNGGYIEFFADQRIQDNVTAVIEMPRDIEYFHSISDACRLLNL
jgi:hypothetical protein